LSFKDVTLEGAYVDREKGIPTASYETVFNDSRTRTWDGHSYLDLKYQTLTNNGTDLTARVFYDQYWYKGDWAYDYSDEGDLSDIELFHDTADGEWWGTELQVNRQFKRHRLIAGGEFRDSLRQEQREYDDYEVYLDIRKDSYTWALFLQDEVNIRDNLILNLGVRYDYFSTVGGTTNPRGALIWLPYQRTSLKLVYGTAFRAPNSYELYYHDGGYTQKPALALDSEEIQTVELVLDQQLTAHLRGVASVYSNEIENLIALTTDPEDDLLVFENLDEVEARGAEIELDGSWEGGWAGALSYSHQRAEDRATGERLVNFPTHMVKFNLIAPLAGEDFTAGLQMLYESGRGTIGGDETDDNLITNLTLFSEKWTDWLKLSIGFYNIFDEEYAHPASEEHEQDQIPQDGRTFRVKAVFTF
jgi:iron complex outermembrane receptor protein